MPSENQALTVFAKIIKFQHKHVFLFSDVCNSIGISWAAIAVLLYVSFVISSDSIPLLKCIVILHTHSLHVSSYESGALCFILTFRLI